MKLYQKLKASGNPQAPFQVIASLLETHSVKEVANIMGTSTRWIYKIRHRLLKANGDLSSCLQKRGPKNPMPNRTPQHIENLVVETAVSTNFGPRRLAVTLASSSHICLSPYTIRNILRRHRLKCRKIRSSTGKKRYFTNSLAFDPLQFWQIDTKYIADQSALPLEAYAAIWRNKLPKFQFTAIDVKSRLRFIAYASELSFKTGLAFLLLLTFWLRAFGIKSHLFFQTDNGSEFGGPSPSRKRSLMQKAIFDPLGVSLLNIPPRQKQFNTFVERSHRTDDEEFYTINLSRVTSRPAFLKMAQDWILYIIIADLTSVNILHGYPPVKALQLYHAAVHPAIGAMPVLNLDSFSRHLNFLWDISILPWDYSPKNLKLVNETMAYYLLPGLYD